MTNKFYQIVIVVLVAAVQNAAQADTTFLEATELLANRTVSYLKEKGITEVRVDKFISPATAPTGPKIQAALAAAISTNKDHKVSCTPTADTDCYSLTGNIYRANVSDSKVIVKITCKLMDKDGKEDATFQTRFENNENSVAVDDYQDVASILATTVDFTTENATVDPKKATEETLSVEQRDAIAKARAEQRDAKVKAGDEAPSCYIDNNGQVSPRQSSPFAIAVKVRNSAGVYELRKPTIRNGKAFLDLKLGEDFAVCAYNKSPHRAALKLELDGINVLEFSQNKTFKKRGKWVLLPGQRNQPYEGVISGWHIDDQTSKRFRVQQLPETAIALLGKDTNSSGAITASFSTAWDPEGPRHPEEPTNLQAEGAGEIGIGIGENFADKKQAVQNIFGLTTLTVITIRYNNPPTDLPSGQ